MDEFYDSIPPRIAFIDVGAFGADWFVTVEPLHYGAGLKVHESQVSPKACKLFRGWKFMTTIV